MGNCGSCFDSAKKAQMNSNRVHDQYLEPTFKAKLRTQSTATDQYLKD